MEEPSGGNETLDLVIAIIARVYEFLKYGGRSDFNTSRNADEWLSKDNATKN